LRFTVRRRFAAAPARFVLERFESFRFERLPRFGAIHVLL